MSLQGLGMSRSPTIYNTQHPERSVACTQVVVDEIHERDSFADFLLIILRDVLPQHPQLRIVLMSATLHIDLFSTYFGRCPVIQVGDSCS